MKLQQQGSLRLSRREVVQSMSIGAAAVLLGQTSARANPASANEVISVGLIGCGGRMRGALLQGVQAIPRLRVDAVCDVYDDFLNSIHAQVGGRDREVFRTKDYRAVLDMNNLDAVIIATPNHWHAPMTIDAMLAGKHVYVEKPLTHKLTENKGLRDARKRSSVAVQVGAQQRTMPHVVILRDKLKSGEIDIGPVHRIDMQWNRNRSPQIKRIDPKIPESAVDWKRYLGSAPDQPFDAFRFRNWRWIWDFGNGPLGDLMVHWLDCTNFLFDLGLPRRIASMGGNYITKGAWEAPDTIKTIFEYPERDLIIDFQCTFTNDFEDGSMRILGQRGTIYLDRGRWEFAPQDKDDSSVITEQMDVGLDKKRGMGSYSGYNAEKYHMLDWLDAAATGRQPVDDIEAGILSSDVCHYGNISLLENRMVEVQ